MDERIDGPLVIVPGDDPTPRLGIKGDTSGDGFHCADRVELEVAPGIWIRGRVELNSSTEIHVHARQGKKVHPGWYLCSDGGGRVIYLLPGMKARRWTYHRWPKPEYPYEGLYWSGDGIVERNLYYRNGQWVEEES